MKILLNKINRLLRKKRVIAAILIIIVATGISYEILIKPEFMKRSSVPLKNSSNTIGIETSVLESREIRETIETLGEIVFKEKVNISSKVNGRLSRILVREGKNVRKGELIAEIERLPLEITLKQQKSELDIARKALELSQ
ncbi:MAG TPA: biotin/lipoyl-binding protein, partial [Spirochaetota bacterium]|nr:biotin/lipoyl-binding protein [Spirochaetota bacterium]HPR36918.1 biotin/lipoyl-binding protein [Spirochaetota bacterium]